MSEVPYLQCRDRRLALDRPAIMGILNLTPDSFSDGGRYPDTGAAIEAARTMVAAGAAIIDLGGESTRPGAEPVAASDEIDRVRPALARLAEELPDVILSIDTMKAPVAEAALEAGAHLVNDVSALGDPGMAGVVARHRAGLVLMHMQGEPRTMQQSPHYDDLLAEVAQFLQERLERAQAAGIGLEHLAVDPGIGFGKRPGDNETLIRHLDYFQRLGRPILVGPSRKSFIGCLTGQPATERQFGTAAAVAIAIEKGAKIVRVHDVPEMARVVAVADAIRQAGR